MLKTYNKTLYHDMYRVETTRATWHDYNRGMYFITICTKNKWHYFGEIPDDEAVIHLTPFGKRVEQIIQELPEKREELQVPVFCVMPNHIHLILDTRECALPETIDAKHTILSVTINLFKGLVTRAAREMNVPFAWQARYWDHVIRDKGYDEIVYYITHNVEQWHDDELHENAL